MFQLTKLDTLKIIMLAGNMLVAGILLIILTFFGEAATSPRLVVFLVGVLLGHLAIKTTTLAFTVLAGFMKPMQDIVDRMANIVALFGFLIAILLYFSSNESQVLMYGFGVYMIFNLYAIASRLLRWSILTHFGFHVTQDETLPQG